MSSQGNLIKKKKDKCTGLNNFVMKHNLLNYYSMHVCKLHESNSLRLYNFLTFWPTSVIYTDMLI